MNNNRTEGGAPGAPDAPDMTCEEWIRQSADTPNRGKLCSTPASFFCTEHGWSLCSKHALGHIRVCDLDGQLALHKVRSASNTDHTINLDKE